MEPTSLFYFLNLSNRISSSYLQKNPEVTSLLQDVDIAYAEVLTLPSLQEHGPLLFAAMAHATFLASVQLSTSGQLPPSYMASRGILEASIYGWWVNSRPELKAVWSNRDESEETKRLVKNSFKIGDIMRALGAHSAPLENQFRLAYEFTIEMGAHPNSGAFWSNLTKPLDDLDGDSIFLYLNQEPIVQKFAVLSAAFSAVTGLLLFLDAHRSAFGATDLPQRIPRSTDAQLG